MLCLGTDSAMVGQSYLLQLQVLLYGSHARPVHCRAGRAEWKIQVRDQELMDLCLTWSYFRMTGCTGAPARKAPVLNSSMYSPLVVVLCTHAQGHHPQALKCAGLGPDPYQTGQQLYHELLPHA